MLRPAMAGLLALAAAGSAGQAQPAATPALGAAPPAAEVPTVEFVFEERVLLGPVVHPGATPYGDRNLVPIAGGEVAGPKLRGTILPYGWDWQLYLPGDCRSLAAEYFIRADDGAVIHILNASQRCVVAGDGSRKVLFRPVFEVPSASRYAWLNSGTFVAELRPEGPPPGGGRAPAPAASSAARPALRIRFYQVHLAP